MKDEYLANADMEQVLALMACITIPCLKGREA